MSNLLQKKQKLENNEHIRFVFYNYVFPVHNQSLVYPNDKKWKGKWNEDMTTGNWGLKAIKAPEAWNYISRQYADPEDIQIGIMEVGPLDTTHEDLKGNLYHVHQELEKKKAEETAHGTYVAGIIGAEYNNNCGITGVMMDNVKLNYYSYNMAKDSGMQSAMCYIASLDALIKAAGTEQTAIINVSMGIQDYQVCATLKNKTAKDELKYLNQAIESQLHMLLNKGYDFLIVKAAGNCSYQKYMQVNVDPNDDNTAYGYIPYYDKKDSNYKEYSYLYKKYKKNCTIVSQEADAQYDVFSGIQDSDISRRILVVGGIENPQGNEYPLYYYSSKGARVDIAAPASRIQSTAPKNKYKDDLWGTSFAAPYVSGVAGLVLSVSPDLTGEELRTLLIASGSGNYNFGIGEKMNYVPLVDAQQAVEKAATYDRNAVEINYEHGFENGEEYAVITGLNQLGETVWEYKTGRYPGTELDRICEIGIQGDWYYFVEDRTVVALDRLDGTVVWKNGEYGGSVSAHVFGPDQTLYLCGTYGPAFMAISKDGKTLCRIDHVAENKVFWPYKMEYADQKITIAFNGNAFESQGDIYCIVDLSDYTYEMEGLEEITFSRKDLEGSWLQTDSEDPMLLILRSDGSMEYYNTVSRSNEYSSKYSQKGGSLCLNLVNLDISGVTEVPYKAEVSEDRKSLTLSLSDPAEEYSKLYGMEKNLEGTYQRISFTQEELDTIKADLGVPDDLEVTVTQSKPYYWSAGGCWLVSVDIKQGEQWVAGASIDPMTMEAVRDILRYSGIQ